MLTGREAFSTWGTERELGSPLLFLLLKLDDQIWGRQKDSDGSGKGTESEIPGLANFSHSLVLRT